MKLQEVIAIAKRKALGRREREAAQVAGREDEVNRATTSAANFLSGVVCPFLKSVETQLKSAGVPSSITERFNTHCARCMLTIHSDEDVSPSHLTFEACRCAVVPQLKCTIGGRTTLLSEPDMVAVSRIVSEFITSSLE
ncbi:MAG TPA: hypothetical protein VG796_00825 [Verrucomicrobiales bacterium]|jgi:hypothetical protein|nr:hypothetical protein [Verrucomicrobiales bacterium]